MALKMWVVWSHPPDYPHGYLARGFRVPGGPCHDELIRASHFDVLQDHLRYQLNGNAKWIAHCPEEDPYMVGVWI